MRDPFVAHTTFTGEQKSGFHSMRLDHFLRVNSFGRPILRINFSSSVKTRWDFFEHLEQTGWG